MAFNFVTGNLGAGKTYYLVSEVVVPVLQKGRRIYHNLPLIEENLKVYQKSPYVDQLVYMDSDFIGNIHVWLADPKVEGAVIIIDEARRFYPSGKRLAEEIKDFYTWSRHHGHEVLFCVQSRKLCNSFFSEFYDQEWHFKNERFRGLGKNKYHCDVFLRGDRARTSHHYGKYKTEIFNLYKSTSTQNFVDEPVGIKSRKALYVFGGAAIALALAFYNIQRVASIGSKPPDVAKSAVASVPVSVPAGKPVDDARKPVPVAPSVGSDSKEVSKEAGDVNLNLFYNGIPKVVKSGRIAGLYSVGARNFVLIENSGKVFKYNYVGLFPYQVGEGFGDYQASTKPPPPSLRYNYNEPPPVLAMRDNG